MPVRTVVLDARVRHESNPASGLSEAFDETVHSHPDDCEALSDSFAPKSKAEEG
jgi:hypothetical protein